MVPDEPKVVAADLVGQLTMLQRLLDKRRVVDLVVDVRSLHLEQ